MLPTPVINIVDDQSTMSGFSDPMDSYLSSASVLSIVDDQSTTSEPKSIKDIHSSYLDSFDYNQYSTASDPLCSFISPLDIPVAPQTSTNQCISSLSFTKNISAIAVVRDYLRMIGSNVSSKIKTIEAMYDTLREESGVCMSQFCSFIRHGSDMGFQAHTVCSPQSCSNYGSCNNNLESLAVLNNGNIQVISTPELGEGNKGLFSGSIGFQIGEFICTYGGEVRLENKTIGSDNKYLMQLAVRYLIDGSKSSSYGKFINHGCGALANARTQFMISTSQIFLGIVALEQINPHEQILLDYCGVVPNVRNSHLSVLKFCTCLNCCPQGASLTRSTRSRKKLTINDSLDKWNEAGRCPDIGAISSSQSSDSSSSSITNLPVPPSTQPTPDKIPSSSANNTLAALLPVRLKSSPRSKKKPFKNDVNKLLIFKDIHNNRLSLMSRFDGPDDSSSASPYPKIPTPCSSSRTKLITFKSHNSKSILENSTILIPFMDLISSGVARRISSLQIAPIFHLIVQFSVKATKAKGTSTNNGSMILEPTHFEWETNPIKCDSSLLIGAIASLQGEEVILREGTLDSLSRKFKVPDLGDIVFQLLKQSSHFKHRDDIDPHNGDYPPRDLSVFPLLDDFSTPPPKSINNHHTTENMEASGLSVSFPGIFSFYDLHK